MIDIALLLLQQGTTENPEPIGVFRFFAAFTLIMAIIAAPLLQRVWAPEVVIAQR